MSGEVVTVEQAFAAALAHHQAGRLPEAEGLYRQILAVTPGHPGSLHYLGAMALQIGQGETALDYFRLALQGDPRNAEIHSNLGVAYHALNRVAEARAAFTQAVTLQPDYVNAHFNLGCLLQKQGLLDDALASYDRVIALDPSHSGAYYHVGLNLLFRRRLPEARVALEHAIKHRPNYHEAWNHVGTSLTMESRPEEARPYYERALALKPDYADAHCNFGNYYRETGQLELAIASYRRAADLLPGNAQLLSNVILTLQLHPETTPAMMRAEHDQWNARFYLPLLSQPRPPYANVPDPGRRLKVGYVSPDFWRHAVSYFACPLIEAHDRAQVEVHCYASVTRDDDVTARLQRSADVWHNVLALSDAQLAERVRADGIDILVDLSLHTAEERLPAFARRPAPVQVSWLGYAGTSGLPAIDYRLTDARIEPPELEQENLLVEEPVRLPDCWCCYDPLGEDTPVGPLPALANNGGVTFGSLNNLCKTNAPLLARWGRTLMAVPGSRLLLHGLDAGGAHQRIRDILAREGVSAERVAFAPMQSKSDYQRTLTGLIDIVFDHLPFNGMTTTCEALWMGVPVLTLPGRTPASRPGSSLLSTVGLEEFIATDAEDFVRRAARLAADLPKLAAIRAGLRERMRASPLMDAPRFARNVEAAYREMWQRWCRDGSARQS